MKKGPRLGALPRFASGEIHAASGILLSLCLLLGLASTAPAEERLRMATTTSVQDSGLLPYLLQVFEKECRCKVDVIAVGSGQALRLASNGDVDMVLVHDPAAEKKFLDDGWGINHRTFMMNDFVILGPSSDPAKIRGIKSAAQAFSKIQNTNSLFISRGDESGTHKREMDLWQKARVKPAGPWRLETGQGMGAVLTMANEKQAYTICDRATYLTRREQLNLQVLVEGDSDLINYYSAMQVNPARFPNVKKDRSAQLIGWLCSSEGQKLIGDYVVKGNRLFNPTCNSGK
jgi:tungstate transport system substrate-binding protein